MGVYEAIKNAVALAQKADNVDLLRKLLDAQSASIEDRETIRALREEVVDLRKRLQLQEELRWEHNVYWRELADGNREGPYCPKCWSGESKLVRFIEWERNIYWHCAVCNLRVHRPGTEAPKPRPPRRSTWLEER